ncbi:unnamed protein product [Rotaria sp. Silwood1]|nr:unnamed protein product [Rotaria sp. Silwood1]CAF1681798.1 unnamed protein product [Rotaria sp. Silwood1]
MFSNLRQDIHEILFKRRLRELENFSTKGFAILERDITICFLLIILHFISIIIPVVTMIVQSIFVQKLLYWLFNIISPSINAQVIVTYILARKSKLCRFITDPFGLTDFGLSLFKAIGNDTIGWNVWLLQFSFSSLYKSNFDENKCDDNALVERHRILKHRRKPFEDEEHADHLTVNNLVKYYPIRKVLDVNHLTFGAQRSEAFGLLGYNVSTAYIDGQTVYRRLRSTRHLGYCPQENCSMDVLTVQNSLYLLARIRGVEASRINSIVENMSSLFLLDSFLNNDIHELCDGPPLVVILDKPTADVDRNARQQMQKIFFHQMNQNILSVFLNSSERICNRLGMMVNGYTVEIKIRSSIDDINPTTIRNVQSFLLSQKQYHVEVKETTHSTGLFQIEHSTPAELFQLLEENKQRLNIETYIISQTTLEQIFLLFGKQIRATTL